MSALRISPAASVALPSQTIGLLRIVAAWRARAQTRAALARLDRHLLQDIGLTEVAMRGEIEKPFWAA